MSKIITSFLCNPKLFWIYLVFILVLVTVPIGSANEFNNTILLRFRADYFLHVLLFLPWAFFRPKFRIHQGWWLLWGLLFAVASEGVQYFLPYRAWNVNDWVANSAGVVLGFGFWLLYAVLRKQQKTAR